MWNKIPSMATARMLAGCVVFRDKIWIVGEYVFVQEYNCFLLQYNIQYLAENLKIKIKNCKVNLLTWS